MSDRKLTRKQEQCARAGAEKIRAAVQIALSRVTTEEAIIAFLLQNADFDASSLSLPKVDNGKRIILAYEWVLLESVNKANLASKILISIRENLKNNKLASDRGSCISMPSQIG